MCFTRGRAVCECAWRSVAANLSAYKLVIIFLCDDRLSRECHGHTLGELSKSIHWRSFVRWQYWLLKILFMTVFVIFISPHRVMSELRLRKKLFVFSLHFSSLFHFPIKKCENSWEKKIVCNNFFYIVAAAKGRLVVKLNNCEWLNLQIV